MAEWTEQEQRRITNQFFKYCENRIKNCASGIRREKGFAVNNYERLSELERNGAFQYAIYNPEYPKTPFLIDGTIVLVSNPDLADSLKLLTEFKREIIMSLYYLEKTEKELARILNRGQQTISDQKYRILEQLKRQMEEAGYDEKYGN